MRKLIFFLIFLLLPFFSFAKETLLIVEVQIEGDNKEEDFIKIYNPSNKTIDISGFKLRKRSSSGKEYSVRVFPRGSKIKERGTFIWANSKGNFSQKIGANVKSTQKLSKNNSIALFNKKGEILDALCWGKSNSPFVEKQCFPQNPSKNEILKRKIENGVYQDTDNNSQDFYLENKKISFKWEIESESALEINLGRNKKPIAIAGPDVFAQTGEKILFDGSKSYDPDKDVLSFFWNFGDGFTSKKKKTYHSFDFPGKYLVSLEVSDGKESAKDTLSVTVYPVGVIINELMPNPQGEDKKEEWIEILNTNNFIVDISGWKIKNEKGKIFIFPKNSLLLPGQFLVLKRDSTKMFLNNNKDSLSFFYPNDILIEKINYSHAKEGESIARNSKGEFFWTKIPTPGLANIFSFEIERQLEKPIEEKEAKRGKEKAIFKNSPLLSPLSEVKEGKIKDIIENFFKKNTNKKEESLTASFPSPFPLKIFLSSFLISFSLAIIVIFFKKRNRNKI